MSILPSPKFYTDWKTWAENFITALASPGEAPVLRAKGYLVADVPPVSVDDDGIVIFVTDEAGGATLAVSKGGEFLRVSDGAPIS